MDSKKTVFVVGAGASFEFGLPIGQKLKEEIAELLSVRTVHHRQMFGEDLIVEALVQAHHVDPVEFDINNAKKAAMQIGAALPLALSIDNFLHVHKGNRAIEICGKLGIARAILRAESSSLLYVSDNETRIDYAKCKDTWIVRFMQLLAEDCSIEDLEDRMSKISFIIFNYDRCVEHFLFHAVQTYYGIDANGAAKIIASINIVHPYGIVGKLPWMEGADPANVIGYGGTPNSHHLLKLAREIKTFTEGNDRSSAENIAMRKSVRESDRLVFLGFAYHRLNLEIMGELGEPLHPVAGKSIFGTAFGMSSSDRNEVEKLLGLMFSISQLNIEMHSKCGELFQQFSRSLGFS